MKKIIVASRNPVKVKAVLLGFQKMFPEQSWEVKGQSAPSGVSDQPMSDQETYLGALNRAKYVKSQFPDADYWVGVEGGIEENETEMNAFAWMVVLSKTQMGKARTGTFFLPPKVAQLVQSGKELGEADDIVFGQSNSKQSTGAVGLLTGNLIDRTQLYLEGMVLALIPFKNSDLF